MHGASQVVTYYALRLPISRRISYRFGDRPPIRKVFSDAVVPGFIRRRPQTTSRTKFAPRVSGQSMLSQARPAALKASEPPAAQGQ